MDLFVRKSKWLRLGLDVLMHSGEGFLIQTSGAISEGNSSWTWLHLPDIPAVWEAWGEGLWSETGPGKNVRPYLKK
jgi:hypothetical protein